MKWSLLILPKAARSLDRLPVADRERVLAALEVLQSDPFLRVLDIQKLKGQDGWRLRVGRYRAVYFLLRPQQKIVVTDIDHRKDIYR